jgi:RNA polymerase sigma-70 factor (ECF subfamily)
MLRIERSGLELTAAKAPPVCPILEEVRPMTASAAGGQGGRRSSETRESTVSLLEKIRQGDADARERLFRRYLAPLSLWARGRVPDRVRHLVDTDDLVQLSLFRALNGVEGFEPRREGAFLAYLRTILVNEIRGQLRRERRAPQPEQLPEIEDPSPSPLEQLVGRETLEAYESAWARLPAEQREAVFLRLELGWTHERVAEAIGSPSSDAARMTVKRAILRIGEEMAIGGS